MRIIITAGLLLFTVLLSAPANRAEAFQSPDRPPDMNSSEILLGLQRLSVLGSVLYVGAHPDDENTNLLAYFTKGRMMRTGYLSLTRGEGGQNLIGPEKGDALGIIRTQELLAARGVDGAEQYFSRAIDFGYSKNSDEAIGFWGGDEIVSDIVRVIRLFRPDVIITRFSPEIGGHGQHTASAILTRRAFDLAADSSYRPADFRGLPPWRSKRLMFNVSSWMGAKTDSGRDIRVNSGGYNPLLGLSYNEISGLSRSMHKSQGFGAAQNRGDVINYFVHTAGDPAASDIFDGIGTTWARVRGGDAVARTVSEALRTFDPVKPAAVVPLLVRALGDIDRLPPSVWTRAKRHEVLRLIQAAAGIRIDALVSDPTAAPGDTITVRASVINRSELPATLVDARFPFAGTDTAVGARGPYNQVMTIQANTVVPADEPAWTPYWLEKPSTGFRYDIADRSLIGLPGRPPRAVVRLTLEITGTPVAFDLPLHYTWVDPVEGELTRPFVVIPPVSVEPVERVILYSGQAPKTLDVRVRAGRPGVSGTVRVETPPGWSASPARQRFSLSSREQTTRVTFTIAASQDAAAGEYHVVAEVDNGETGTGTAAIRYPHIPAQVLFPEATGHLLPADLARKKFFVGYIAGSGDDVPEALRQMGYDVRLLSDEDLLTSELSGFEAIVAGVRAYNTREVLQTARQRLMDYVSRGGTYVVQYVTSRGTVTDSIGPFAFSLSRDRVAEEDAPVTLLAPGHPALTFPNRITPEDFSGWVQERGLYFADGWDSSYTPVISMNDRGEPARQGSLIVARYGSGYFCYTGLSFFRQLPAGVAGAYRLFANLVELGSLEKISGKEEDH
jgi:LmbE family N-acetylglucosaminyl deacetylase